MDSKLLNTIILDASDAINRMNEGTDIPHQTLETMLLAKKSPGDSTYYNRVNKLRNFLMVKYGMFLQVINGYGYKIVKSGDEIKLCRGRAIKGIKQIHRASCETIMIRLDNISDPVKRNQTVEVAQKISALDCMTRMGSNFDDVRSLR